MMSSAYNFIYLHVPKTAGNSIQKALLPHSDDKIVLREGQDGTDRFGLAGPITPAKHATLAEYEARAPGIAQRMTVVISVRHPFERAVSYFFHTLRAQQIPLPKTQDDTIFWQMIKRPIFRPMVDFLTLSSGIHAPQHILRNDHLADDFARMCQTLGLPLDPATALPHLNRSDAPTPAQAKYLQSRALRDEVEAYYQRDMDYFSYPSYPC